MALELTQDTRAIKDSGQIRHQLVLEIEGVGSFFSLGEVRSVPKYGDVGLTYGGSSAYGVQIKRQDAQDIISFSGGTSSEIRQVLNIDKGTNSSTSLIRISLLDKDFVATKLISPGAIVPDILGRRCKLWMGFPELKFKDDYAIVFRGQIESVDAKSGIVSLTIASSDSKKRASIFQKGNTELFGSLASDATTIPCIATASFLGPNNGPSGSPDTSLRFFIRIDDELMEYTNKTVDSFTTVTRGALGTAAVAHDDEAEIESFYLLEGHCLDLSLKLMLSGLNDYYLKNELVASIVDHDFGSIANSLFFRSSKIVFEDNVVAGDYLTVTDDVNSSNNVTLEEIASVEEVFGGVLVTLVSGSLVASGEGAKVSFRSQYDVFGPGAGFAMRNDEVDIKEHLDIKTRFLPTQSYRFFLRDEIKSGLDFLAEQIYNPVSAFAIPRKAQSSVGYHVGPVPGVGIKTIDNTNCLNASDLSVQRSISKNFYNAVVYKYDQLAIEERFKSGLVSADGESATRIPIGARPLYIDATGMRSDLGAATISADAASRRLGKYGKGAEFINGVKVKFGLGFDIEVGDKVLVDMASLKLSDIRTQSRSGAVRLFEIVNKFFNIRQGVVTVDCVDTNFDLSSRFGLIAASSLANKDVIVEGQVRLLSSTTTPYTRMATPTQWQKWQGLEGSGVKIINSAGDVLHTGVLSAVNPALNALIIPGIPVSEIGSGEDIFIVFDDYTTQGPIATSIYAYMSNGDNDFADELRSYQMS